MSEASRGRPLAHESAHWVDLVEPSPSTLRDVATTHQLHPLALEDAEESHQRAKLERYDDGIVVIAKPASYDDQTEQVTIGELFMFVSTNCVITVRRGPAADLPPPFEHPATEEDLGRIVHGFLDRIVDDYLSVARDLAVDIGEIESDVFSEERTNPSDRIYRLKRQVLDLLHSVDPLLEPLELLADGRSQLPAMDRHREYFRDVSDHAHRLVSELRRDSALLSDVLQANLAQVSVQQNDDMRRMSAWAAIFLVPSLLAGIWGMNFASMPELDWRWGYPTAVAAMLGTSIGLWLNFRRIGWLRRR